MLWGGVMVGVIRYGLIPGGKNVGKKGRKEGIGLDRDRDR